MASIRDGDAYWVIQGTGWRTGRSLSMARAPGGRQGVAGQLADPDGQGGGAEGLPGRRGGQVEQSGRREEVEQQRQRQRGPPGPGESHGGDDEAGGGDDQGRVAAHGGDHGGLAGFPGGAAAGVGAAAAALSARTSSVSSLISRPRKKLSAVRMAATVASCASSVKLGATAVRRMSAASWNSRPSTRKRPRSSRSRANGSSPSRRKATRRNRTNAITAPTKMIAAPAASTSRTRTLTTFSRLCSSKPSARLIISPYPALARPNPVRGPGRRGRGGRRARVG